MRICQTGVVGEILCACFGCPLHGKSLRAIRRAALAGRTAFRLSYVKYSTGANKATRTAYRALGKPDWPAARRAFRRRKQNDNTYNEKLFRRDSAISRLQRLFFAYFFLTSQKKVCPRSDAAPIDAEKWAAGGIPRLRRIRNGPAARFCTGWRKKPERGLPFPVSQFSESSRK